MKLTYKKVKEINETLDVPDYFGWDDTLSGKVVDILVGKRVRDDLFEEDEAVIKNAVTRLEAAYKKADEIVELIVTETGGV